MSRPLQRLARVRALLCKQAEHAVKRTQSEVAATEASRMSVPPGAPPGSCVSAAELQHREALRARLLATQDALEARLRDEQHTLRERTREQRQVDRLLEHRATASAQRAGVEEQRRLDDWLRGRDP